MSTVVKFSYEQDEEMIRLGLFDPPEEHRVELIHGEIVPIDGESPMSPINPPDDDAVDEWIDWCADVLPRGGVRIRAQGSIVIPLLDSQPQPDFTWMAPRSYRTTRPVPDDVLLFIEVSESNLAKDRGEKARLDAEAGIRDYSIVNPSDRCIEARRDLIGSIYQSIAIFQRSHEVHPLAVPDVSRLFPD